MRMFQPLMMIPMLLLPRCRHCRWYDVNAVLAAMMSPLLSLWCCHRDAATATDMPLPPMPPMLWYFHDAAAAVAMTLPWYDANATATVTLFPWYCCCRCHFHCHDTAAAAVNITAMVPPLMLSWYCRCRCPYRCNDTTTDADMILLLLPLSLSLPDTATAAVTIAVMILLLPLLCYGYEYIIFVFDPCPSTHKVLWWIITLLCVVPRSVSLLKGVLARLQVLRKGGLFLRTKQYHWSIFKKLLLIRSGLIVMKLVKSFLKTPQPLTTNHGGFLVNGCGLY